MGISSSKPAAPPIAAPTFKGAVQTSYADTLTLQQEASNAVKAANDRIAALTKSVGWSDTAFYGMRWAFIILFVASLFIILYDTFAPDSWPDLFFIRNWKTPTLPSPAPTPTGNPPKASDSISLAQKPPVSARPPPLLSKLYSSIFGSGSGDLAPSFHDATTSAIIQGNRAPLSSQKDGAYGMQWWMYVKDWNYGYGKDKSIVVRPDVTNASVLNPSISLHPTDNSLRVSVSVFPATSGGTSTSTPAPAGHSGSTDDVFICDVPNIPLQTWFAVGVTVFGRNLDVYIDGKLVKSCFLTGVPKPAVGDIQLTPGGGFSGRICGFNHYPKMLTPSDTAAFWSAGTSCRNKTPDTGASASSATGYSIKFGVYDSLGKEVQEYAF